MRIVRLSRRGPVAGRLMRLVVAMTTFGGFVVVIVGSGKGRGGGNGRRIVVDWRFATIGTPTLSEFEVTSNRFLQVEHGGCGLGYLYTREFIYTLSEAFKGNSHGQQMCESNFSCVCLFSSN